MVAAPDWPWLRRARADTPASAAAPPAVAAVLFVIVLLLVGLRDLGVALAIPAWLAWLPWFLGAATGGVTVVLSWWGLLLIAVGGDRPRVLAATSGWALTTLLCVLTGVVLTP